MPETESELIRCPYCEHLTPAEAACETCDSLRRAEAEDKWGATQTDDAELPGAEEAL